MGRTYAFGHLPKGCVATSTSSKSKSWSMSYEDTLQRPNFISDFDAALFAHLLYHDIDGLDDFLIRIGLAIDDHFMLDSLERGMFA